MPYKDKAKEKARQIRNREQRRIYMQTYSAEHREQERERCRLWHADPANKEKRKPKVKAYAVANRHVNRAATKKYREANKAKCTAMVRDWMVRNRERVNAYNRAYSKERYETDMNYAIRCKLRARLYKKITSQGIKKASSSMSLTGCTAEFLRGYLESQFKEGMTWENIHIDHHIPCAEFDLRDPVQQLQCFHYSNLRPLFAVDNMRKGAKTEV